MPVPVINISQMREWEKSTWAAGQTEAEVIRRVGKKIAKRARKLTRSGDTILILAGKGNNGNDARAAQEFLEDREIILLNATEPQAALAEFQSSTNVAPASDFSASNRDRRNACPALIIDGLFGIGLNRPLDDDWKKLISSVNETKIPVLAVDTPSGLNCETGEVEGAAIEATITLTVGAPKIGMLAKTAWPFVGQLEVLDDVGLIPCPLASELNWILPDDFENFTPRRPVAGHKGLYGHLTIVAGSFGFHGAAILAARAAQRAQPGLITLFTQEAVYHAAAAQLQAVMVNVFKSEIKFPETTGAILIGPGLHAPGVADEMKKTARRLWRDSPLPVIVDASALDWLVPHSLAKNLIRVITPHPGEAARMLNSTSQQVQSDRPQALRELSKKFGNCHVVLKGHQTLVGRSAGLRSETSSPQEGEIFVNSSGNPFLAQGGSGDVLSGYIAGLLAQPQLQTDAGKTIRFAVWQHGAAADALQEKEKIWGVENLIEELGNPQ